MGIYPDGQVQPLINAANGGPSSVLSLTGFNDPSSYGVTISNAGAGGHLNVAGHLLVTSAGVTIGTLGVTTLNAGTANITTANVTTLAVSGNSALGDGAGDTTTISGNATVGGSLGAGATTVTTLTASGAAALNGAVTLGDAAGDTITVNGTPTFATAVTFNGNVTVNGDTALGNANTDLVTVIGVSTFRNAANTATQLFVDAGNNRVIVGTATALGSDTTPNLQVVGRLYVAPSAANDSAIQVRRSSAATVGWTFGVEAANDLIFKDDADTSIVRFGDAVSTYQLDVVTGDFHVADDAVIAGDISASRVVAGGTTFSGGEELRVVGQTSLEGATTVTTGGLTVTAGGLTVTAGGITVSAGDVSVPALIISSSNGAFLNLTGSNQYQTTVGAAGGASALPANPTAYVKVQISGTTYVFPIYEDN